MSILLQNTPEWMEMRKTKIGASDAPIIMKKSPYKTPYRLWQEKLDLVEPQKVSFSMQRGHDLEEEARRKVEEMTGILFVPMVKFHPKLEWMMCSSDGISIDSTAMVEIKCANKDDHKKALNGIVPEKYMPQLQHQLEVVGLDSMIYFSFDGREGAIVNVSRDDKYIKAMLKEEERFYECLQNLEPPAFTERDFKKMDSVDWECESARYIELDNQIKALEIEKSDIKNNLISIAQNNNACGNGIFLKKMSYRGKVNYNLITELESVDLNKYRSAPTEFWKISKNED